MKQRCMKIKTFVKKRWIYLIGLLISVVMIGLYFIDSNNAWCVLSCSIGASLIGAVGLGWSIDWKNETNRRSQNKKIFQIANTNIYSEINSLLMAIYHPIKELNSILKISKNFEYEDKSLENLFDLYADFIKKIKENTAPMITNNEEVSDKFMEYMRTREEAETILRKYNSKLQDFRKKFDELKEKFEINKNLLLVNDAESEKTIFMLSAILGILGTQTHNELTKDYELIEYGESFEELKHCNLMSAFDAIGFDIITFNNKKGYFDFRFFKGKTK